MRRLVNPSVDQINAAYRAAKASGKFVIETIERDMRFREVDYVQQWVGVPDGVQVIYVLTRKELGKFKKTYEVILNAAA